MAGTMTSPTAASGVVSTSESKNSLGSEMVRLITEATFAGVSDDEVSSEASVPRVQSSAPTSVVNDFWSDTTSKLLKRYEGASSQERWQACGANWMTLKNSTGGTRSSGDVVSCGGTPVNMTIDNDASGTICLCVAQESITNGSFGAFRMRGIMTVKVNGAVTRGNFLKRNTANASTAKDNGTTLSGSFAWALTAAAGPGDGTVTALLFAHNA